MNPAAPTATAPAPGLLQRFDVPGPRYTSYPTADRFAESFGPADAQRALARSPAGAAVSLYVHIPFCESVCYYCACNKVITRHHERAAEYLEVLDQEIAQVHAALGRRRAAQLHLGGGSPTFLADAELAHVVSSLRRRFDLDAATEMSIEVDPRTVTPARLDVLRRLGFGRLSFGVQDFDPQVQQAVHRVQPFEQVQALMAAARRIGFQSVNADLIHGLPRQTAESFARTVQQIGELRPDRIALYGYAHLPQRFKPQRRIVPAELPGASQRVAMLEGAIAALQARGYVYIGMDHFALPHDALAVAQREGRLQRDFQGYGTQAGSDLVALGVSAISSAGGAYWQNAKALPDYYELVRTGRLPAVRGLELSADDRVRRDWIMALMCRGRVDFEAIEHTHGIRVHEHFAAELTRLEPLREAGLVQVSPGAIEVTPTGWYVVRAIAMLFDSHLAPGVPVERFSRVV